MNYRNSPFKLLNLTPGVAKETAKLMAFCIPYSDQLKFLLIAPNTANLISLSTSYIRLKPIFLANPKLITIMNPPAIIYNIPIIPTVITLA